jgi:hypothetical protein
MNISLTPEHENLLSLKLKKENTLFALEVISAAFKVLAEKEVVTEELHQTKNENEVLLNNFDDSMIRDFMKISESALNKYWLNEEEDEAWKNL